MLNQKSLPLQRSGEAALPAVLAVDEPAGPRAGVRAPLRDFIALTKPRITLIVLATCGAGLYMAPGAIAQGKLAASLAGTVLVVSAANALNMWWEREVDALMTRTRSRPLPAGRMSARAALSFGLALGAISVPLLFAVNALTGFLGLIALVSYVAVYTPLKRHTPWALQVGAVPGAIPPLLGWSSVTGRLDAGALVLFGLVFMWQIPHFAAIALFRADDYARAGLKVLAVANGERHTKLTMLVSTVLLVALSLAPLALHMAGVGYVAAALLLGGGFVYLAARGLRAPSTHAWARSMFGYSIIYLMVLLGSLLVDRIA